MGRGDIPVEDPTAMGIIPETETPKSPEEAREIRKTEIFKMALELVKSGEVFPFSGVRKDFYDRTKVEEVDFVEKGYVTPIDDVLAKFQREGMNVVFGDDPMSGNVFVVPGSNSTIVEDSFRIQDLEITSFMDVRLAKLIEFLQNKA